MNQKINKRAYGFSLVELLISISIIGILVTISIASFSTINKNSRDTKRRSDIEQIRSALEMYRADNRAYPDSGCAGESCLSVSVSELSTVLTDYLSIMPHDPNTLLDYWYRPMGYETDTNYYSYCLSANLEREDPVDSCDPDLGYNWGVKNP